MALSLHDTLTSQKKPLALAEPGHVKLYVCGPTVQDFAHLGHLRGYTIYDVLVRHLRESGLRVTYVRNVTDVDDKILAKARELGEDPVAMTKRISAGWTEDLARIGAQPPDVEPRVSDHIPHIVALIAKLIDRGAAYASHGDVYFRVSAFPGYGKLSHRKLEDLEAGASGRTSDAESERKEHPADFALWKGAREGEVSWPSPWGAGRPGWHIECSAMALEHLGETFDLHAGGLDLVFPHHENEIAQSEAASGKTFACHWMHHGFVEVNKEKMSKSVGNFFSARFLYERVEPEALRYYALTTYYRGPMPFESIFDEAGQIVGFPQIEDAERRVEYLYSTHQRLAQLPAARIVDDGKAAPKELTGLGALLAAALDDDLNTAGALAAVSEFLRSVNELCDQALRKKGTASRSAIDAAEDGFARIARVLGLGAEPAAVLLGRIRTRRAKERGLGEADVEQALAARVAARAAKDFAKADALRGELAMKGVEIMDGTDATTWRMAAPPPPVRVHVAADGALTVDDEPGVLDALVGRLRDARAAYKPLPVLLDGERSALGPIAAAAREAGAASIAYTHPPA